MVVKKVVGLFHARRLFMHVTLTKTSRRWIKKETDKLGEGDSLAKAVVSQPPLSSMMRLTGLASLVASE